jgi:pimeloyl-ACP methyl ester carboxylesterase
MWSRLPRSIRAERRAEGEALRADIASVSGTAPFVAGSVGVPVTSVAGSDTTWFHKRAAEELAAAVPDGALVLLEGATHGGHLTHPAQLAQIVQGCMDRWT